MRFILYIWERKNIIWLILILCAFVLPISILDYLTGPEVGFRLVYLIPVSLITWFTNRALGAVVALITVILWFFTDLATGRSYSHRLIYIWDFASRLFFLWMVVLLLSRLRLALQREQELARMDSLTGAMNPRVFYELTEMEISRSARYKHPVTVAYIDIDNFKTVNDTLGHNTGDRLLCTVTMNIRKYLRKTDAVARLGGDEFAILLPETGQEAARAAMEKIKNYLLQEMDRNRWPVTFSIGVITCVENLPTGERLIQAADALMYSAKNQGKNDIHYSLGA